MSRRWLVRILHTARVAWFRRAWSLLGTWVLACLFVLGIATPSRAEGGRAREVRVCVRPPGVPANLDRWVHSPGGKVLTERWALMVYKNRLITVYVFDPKAPAISATYLPPGLFSSLKCPAKVAPKNLEPKAAHTKSEAGPRKKKGAEEPKPNEPEREEREATKARPKIENDEAKRERERREKQAREDELHRWRERERPKVLPRHGATAAWPSKVLPEQKREGVTAAWPSKVIPTARVLPTAGAGGCGLPAPKLAGGKDGAATMAVREPILNELLGYRKAQSPTEKEAHRRKLRELFESVGTEAASPFQLMLGTQNALAVTFREVLKNDPLQNELLGILAKKFAPVSAQCTPAAPATAPAPAPAHALPDPGPPPGVTREAYEESKRRMEEKGNEVRRQERAAFKQGEIVGEALGKFEADVKHYLSIVELARLTPEEREKEAEKILKRSEALPQMQEHEDPNIAQHYEAGVASGYGDSYVAATALVTAVSIAVEFVKYRGLRHPSLRWGRWAGTPGNSKFLINAEAVKKYGLDKVSWIRFAKGKADFSAVSYKIQGNASIRVPGLTGDRKSDYAKTVEELSKQLGKNKTEVEQLLSSQGLRVHHYRNDLIQLVPKNYHSFAHQGTVADLKQLAALGGAGAGVYGLLADFMERK